jgi:GNAT superfamily N-acetyltransferase
MNELLKKHENLNLEVFIVVNRLHWDKYKALMEDFPFKTVFIDPSTTEGYDFTYEMVQLNEKAYGAGMAAPDWTFANFGTIGAGLTAGFLIDGIPVAKLCVVGNVSDPKIAHEWTLLVDPAHEGEGLGSLTFALALHLVQDKDYLTFIIQTDNPSSNIYLKNVNPLNILSYGFVHTRKNSMLVKTKIPKEKTFETVLGNPTNKFELDDYPMAKDELESLGDTFWIQQNNSKVYRMINEEIKNGKKYIIKGKHQDNGISYFLISEITPDQEV